jgi:cytochrome c553
MQRRILFIAIFVLCLGLILRLETPTQSQTASDGRTAPGVTKLSNEAKLGAVTFNHADHATKNRSADLKTPIDCVVCHHTAMPAAEVSKRPGHKTAWPADRTTTLTSDLFTKDANAPVVNRCRECHARAGEKPTLLPEIPTMKFEGATEATTLNNQQAFHRNCGDCHDAIAKIKADSTAPTSKKCTACHKKTAA